MTGLSGSDGTQKRQRDLQGLEEKGYWGSVDGTTYVSCTDKEIVGIDVAHGNNLAAYRLP